MITIKTFTFNSFQVNTYLLYDETGETLIIDPACESSSELEQLSTFITNNNLKPVAITNTHGHIDHIVGVNDVKNTYAIPFKLHTDDTPLIENALYSAQIFGFSLETVPVIDEALDGKHELKFGHSTIKMIHVPGHAPGSICYYSEDDKFVIVGDVLFSGSIGRTDLPGGDYDLLISGIREKLLTLPGDTAVYPGHGPGTSIQQEHDTNPFLK